MTELASSALTILAVTGFTLMRAVLRHPVLVTGMGPLLFGGVAEIGSYIGCSENRDALARIMRNLRKGMSRTETEEVLSRHEAHFFVRRSTPDGLAWCADVGRARAWCIEIAFSSDATLTTARLVTEDGPRPKGMPPDIA